MLRFFADHCIPNFIIEKLRSFGSEVLRLREYIPADSPDSLVISKAQELDTILITLNGHFTNIVMYPPQKYKGIIALQVRNHPEIIPQIMNRLILYLSNYSDINDFKGKLLLVEAHRIRVMH